MTASEMAAFADMSDAETTAVAYVEAAGGDPNRALLWAIEDLIALEHRFAQAQRSVSKGYIRAAAMERA
ncbi:hypothetical protein [Methylobacterium iners]|uniref:Uncharacterized protein n=1 Tax=Methylobacterium iners TaxID=418707 RepID=A0ABQ4RZ08_9HYPH|nr:hypothetical protein [Methylobacterium iners]GJD95407.1 hypothetical protein OCOJLMKI_2619 [Methylobacterium iners]